MSLVAQARSAVEIAFSAAGDAIVSVTWIRPSIGAYDTSTGVRSTSETTITVRSLEEKVSVTTATRLKLTARAIRLWIPAVDFEDKGLTGDAPLVGDKFTHRGTTYTCRERHFEGVQAIWEIHGDI